MFSDEEIKAFADGRRLMLVEDNEINALIAETQLKSAGFTVEWFQDGAQGLERYMNTDQGYFSCIITDLMMPVMDGPETAKRIRNSGRGDSEIPIIAITANAFAANLDSYRESGINRCFIKPYNKKELLEFVCENVKKYEENSVAVNKNE